VDGTEQTGQSSSQGQSGQTQQSGSAQGNGSQSSQASGQTGQQQAPVRPEYVPENFWDATKNEVKGKEFSEHLNTITARIAADESRRLTLPQKADDYKVELPADFKAPEGIKFEFKADDPLLAQARTLAHEMGIPQEGFQKLLGLYAGSQVASQQAVTTARNAEIAKLGATGPARVDAVTTVFKAVLGEAEGTQLASRMFTAADVQIAEKLVAKLTGQGTFKNNMRDPPQTPGRVSDAEYKKMTPAQRLDYNQKFDQKSMPAWKDPRAA
jgi:hypothetical protein